jgi:hypothetical protein
VRPTVITRAGLYTRPTLIASVPIVPVSTNAYAPAPAFALTPFTRSWIAAAVLFSSSINPMMLASSPRMALTTLSRWRVSSAVEFAPRQSSPPVGPLPVSSVVK